MDVVVAEVQAREEGQVLQAIHVKRGDLGVVKVCGGGGELLQTSINVRKEV